MNDVSMAKMISCRAKVGKKEWKAYEGYIDECNDPSKKTGVYYKIDFWEGVKIRSERLKQVEEHPLQKAINLASFDYRQSVMMGK